MPHSQTAVQQIINGYWNQRAATYDTDQHRAERLEADHAAWTRIAAAALPVPPARVLDVGTGSGFFAFILANHGFDVLGCDLAESMIELAREVSHERMHHDRCPPEFMVSDAMQPDVEPGTMDAITARYVMWTLPDPLRALLSWKRLLAPGGTLALIDAPWFPAGLQANATPGFAEAYSAGVGEHLPLAESGTIDDTVAVVRQAGFHHVEVVPLDEVYHLDQITGAAPGHHIQVQYLITAKSPRRIEADAGDHAATAQTAVELINPELNQWVHVFSMASDPTRLRLLIALHAAPESTVTQLASALQLSPNTVTQALARLEKAHLTASRAEGRFRRWRLQNEHIHELLHHVSAPHSELHPRH